jgi:prepilin-type N-terminal cleavage/methylation domain-containing protein
MIGSRRGSGYSLVEVSAVLVLAGILIAGVYYALGNFQERSLCQQVAADLHRITLAKAQWRYEHATEVFPVTESDRFDTLRSYMKVGLQTPLLLSDIQPTGVSYTICGELELAQAATGATSFDLATETFN